MSFTIPLSYRVSKPSVSVLHRKGSKFPLAMGRWVKTYDSDVGVQMHAIRPIYGFLASNDTPMSVMAIVLSDLTKGAKLRHLHLLIAPASETFQFRKLHCLNKKTRSYLGVTTVTEPEVNVLKQYENQFKFELSFTELYFSPRMLALDPVTMGKLLDHTSMGLFKSNLTLCTSKSELKRFRNIGIQVQLSKPMIRSLGKPKIPVRVRKLEEIRKKLATEPKPVSFLQNYYCSF